MRKSVVSIAIALVLVIVLAGMAYAAPAAQTPVPFKGSLQAVESYEVNVPTLLVQGSGSGNATHLGRYSISYGVVVDLVTASGPASAHLVAANGDSLYAEGHGQATETGTPGVNQIVETYTITGGTGRFTGASGSFTVRRIVDLATGATSGSFDGYIVKP